MSGGGLLQHANQQADKHGAENAPAAVCNCAASTSAGTDDKPIDIYIDPDKYPEAAKHVQDAQDAGHPAEETVDRDGASARRRAATSGTPTQTGKDRDEYPPAILQEGGRGSSVRPSRQATIEALERPWEDRCPTFPTVPASG